MPAVKEDIKDVPLHSYGNAWMNWKTHHRMGCIWVGPCEGVHMKGEDGAGDWEADFWSISIDPTVVPACCVGEGPHDEALDFTVELQSNFSPIKFIQTRWLHPQSCEDQAPRNSAQEVEGSSIDWRIGGSVPDPSSHRVEVSLSWIPNCSRRRSHHCVWHLRWSLPRVYECVYE